MTLDPTYIDQIVQNVMREMNLRTASVGTGVSAAKPVEVKTAPLAVAGDALVKILTKVISEDILIAAGAAGKTVSLTSGAIVTPSGRDFIKKNGVRVSSEISKPTGVSSGALIVIGTSPVIQSAATSAGWSASAAASELEAASAAASRLTQSLVVTCGGEPSVVACLLNRKPEVRAAVITKSTNLITLTTVMSPHVVCLDSSGWSFGDILKLLRSLSAASRPQAWREI